MNYTLSYNPSNKGWPSFYSYLPDYMGWMNQFFYTWKGGNLFRHNSSNVDRNTFYGEFTETKIISLFNQNPIEKKVFKTINTESTHPWNFTCFTDLEDGEIDRDFFEKKEGAYFAYIRGINTVPAILSDYLLRSAQGLGACTAVDSTDPTAVVISFSVKLDSIVSIGDYIYHSDTPAISGVIVGINRTLKQVTIDTTAVGGTSLPITGEYILSMKNNVAESNGVRGDYMEYEIINNETGPTELFVIKSQVFKSFP